MKTKYLILAAVILFYIFYATSLRAGDQMRIVSDPVADYISRNSDKLRSASEKSERVVKIELDLSSNGRKDVFLSFEKTGLHPDEYENKVYSWTLYRNLGGNRYMVFDNKKSKRPGDGVVDGQTLDFDPEKIYVGYINEVKTYGLLAMYFSTTHNKVTIAAYILRGNHFEVLNFPDPEKPAEVYHHDDAWNVPDLPDSYKHYFSTRPTEKITIVQ